MAGLIVIGVVVAYVALFWFIVAKAKHWAARVAAVAVSILIPFWDLPIGLTKLQQHCTEDGGVRVDKDLVPTDAILIAKGSGIRPESALSLGFRTVEYEGKEGITRYTRSGVGNIKSVHPTAGSSLRYEFHGQQLLPWNLTKTEYVVSRLSDGRVLARQTTFGWRGTWWEIASKIQFTTISDCSAGQDRPLLSYVVSRR